MLAALRSIIIPGTDAAASQCLIRKSFLNLCSMIGCGRHSDGLCAKRPILLWQSRPSSGHSVQNSDAGRLDRVSSSKYAHPMVFVTSQQSPVLNFVTICSHLTCSLVPCASLSLRPMYFAMYGCEGMGGGLSSYEDTVAVTIYENEGCNNEANPIFGFCFFGFYIFIAGFLMLNLFIGVIMVRTQLYHHLHSNS